MRLLLNLVLVGLFFGSLNAQAWGRRGHSIVCQTAAALLSDRSAMLKQHSFDLGYYCNVPDLVWKKPATYAVEAPQHFMDLEIFKRAFAARPSFVDPFLSSRLDFEKQYPEIPASAGRAYWRIREMMDVLGETAKSLRESNPADKIVSDETGFRFAHQEKWLVVAGAIGHYVGDLSQPLHVTEDYDGQAENQKGVHAWFEDAAVDELSSGSHPGRLEADVGALAVKNWKAYHEKSAKISVLDLIKAEASESNTDRAQLLKIDKRVGRKDIRAAALAFEPMLRARLAAGAVVLAELWSRELDWKYDDNKFYNFSGVPDYITPPATAAAPSDAVVATPVRSSSPKK